MPVDSRFMAASGLPATDFEKHVYRPFAVVRIV